mmetsp:Transcript_5353/g.5835  ORF Transcript_5353/g.5835 Transcript_5353/m.5835 type:complete len:118 (-) Transcript_5353:221-574(-)
MSRPKPRIVIMPNSRGDVFNNYRMEVMKIRYEEKDNGVHTYIDNLANIARALNRKPKITLKFFSLELQTESRGDDTYKEYMLIGRFSEEVLADTLDKFIQLYIICNTCMLPETSIRH